jgi:hypothetical protein
MIFAVKGMVSGPNRKRSGRVIVRMGFWDTTMAARYANLP